MKLVLVNSNLIGETLASPIYTDNGVMFLNKGNAINEGVISRLKRMCISTIYVEDGNDEITLQEVVPAPVKLQCIKVLKEIFDEILKKEHVNESKVLTIVKDVMQNINLSENAAMLNNLAPNDKISKLAIHSIDVTILTLMVCIRKKFDEKKLLKIGMAALLHDIGKLYSEDKTHVIKGQELLKKNTAFTSTTYMAIYYLYEREDGTGLFGLTGDKIHEFSQVIGICNEYIKYISGDKGSMPHVSVEKITADAISKFNKEIYKDFVQSVYCYPNGLQVKVNNGLEGIVAMQNSGATTRPVLCLKTGEGYKFCNLLETENLKLFIEEVII